MTTTKGTDHDKVLQFRSRETEPHMDIPYPVLSYAAPHRRRSDSNRTMTYAERAIAAAHDGLPLDEQLRILANWVADGERSVPDEQLNILRRRYMRLTDMRFPNEEPLL